METRKLSGKITADAIKSEIVEEVNQLKKRGIVPGLATVLVGEDPASEMYVESKVKTCSELGMFSELVRMPAETTEEQLLEVIEKLNNNDKIDGILVQLPLPGQINETPILEAIRPDKDVDGFHPVNTGKTHEGRDIPGALHTHGHHGDAGPGEGGNKRGKCCYRRQKQYRGETHGHADAAPARYSYHLHSGPVTCRKYAGGLIS